MEKNKIQAISFIAMLLAGIMLWVYPAIKKRIGSAEKGAEKYKVVDMARLDYSEDFFEMQKKMEGERPKQEWARDPFQLSLKEAGAESELRVNGLAVDEKGRIAMINNEIVREGDVILGVKVLKITDDSVIIQKDGKECELEIYEDVN